VGGSKSGRGDGHTSLDPICDVMNVGTSLPARLLFVAGSEFSGDRRPFVEDCTKSSLHSEDD
jgi:hypothetical protein